MAAMPAHRDDGRMFTDNEGSTVPVAGDIVMKPALQEQDRFEIDCTEEVGLEGVRRLCNIVHRASYNFSDRCKFSSGSTNCKQARFLGGNPLLHTEFAPCKNEMS